MLRVLLAGQSVRVSATATRSTDFAPSRNDLQARAQDLQTDLNRLARQPAIRKQALDAGLGQLGEPLVVPAR